jgi:hypothetical protein
VTQRKKPFSERFGYRSADAKIVVREDAPVDFRSAIVALANQLGLAPAPMRKVVCAVLLKAPDRDNWSEYPNIYEEIQDLVSNCPWPKVYDLAEAFYDTLSRAYPPTNAEFESRLNEFFREHGIGWEMSNGKVIARGSEAFSVAPKEAIEELKKSGRQTASREVHEALRDLSRRPEPDVSGSIQHAMAALECVARDITGEQKTLGKLISDHKAQLRLPRPLDEALEKLWGYASETGRHLREGREPRFEEAELVVTVAAAVALYLDRLDRQD